MARQWGGSAAAPFKLMLNRFWKFRRAASVCVFFSMGNWDKDFAVMLLMEEIALIHQEDVTLDELHGPWPAQKKSSVRSPANKQEVVNRNGL